MFDSDFKAGKVLEWFITVLKLLCTVQLYVINYTFEKTFLDYYDKKSPQLKSLSQPLVSLQPRLLQQNLCTSLKLLNCHWWYKSKCTLNERCVRFAVMWSWVIFAVCVGKFWVVQLYGCEVSRPSSCPLLWKNMILGWHIIYSVKSSNRVIDVDRYWTIISPLKIIWSLRS